MPRMTLWKIVKLPTPFELGWSDDPNLNALPMRDFCSPGDKTPTWEDWEEKMQKEYSFRYFLVESLPRWMYRHIVQPLKDAKYWAVCHFVPSHRYHMLDLRQPLKKGGIENIDTYRWGWIESDNQMLYAIFNIFNDFVEHQFKHHYCPSEEDVQTEPYLLQTRNLHLEIKAIHYWWNVERCRMQNIQDKLLHDWSEARRNDTSAVHQLWDELHKGDQAFDDKTDEMIMRLMKIRRSLWT